MSEVLSFNAVGITRTLNLLRYLDANLAREPDPIQLARELGYQLKAIRRLQEKHGEGLLTYLIKVKRSRIEKPRFMASQQGQVHPMQYVSSVQGAIDDAEAPDPSEIDSYRASRAARELWSRERIAETEDLLAAMTELEATINGMSRDRKRALGKTLWILRTRLSRAQDDLRRRNAA